MSMPQFFFISVDLLLAYSEITIVLLWPHLLIFELLFLSLRSFPQFKQGNWSRAKNECFEAQPSSLEVIRKNGSKGSGGMWQYRLSATKFGPRHKRTDSMCGLSSYFYNRLRSGTNRYPKKSPRVPDCRTLKPYRI